MASSDPGFLGDPTLLLEFIAESQEHLDTVDEKLLEYERSPADPELINTIFRAIHSIKGAAGFFNLTAIAELSHKLETLLNELRNAKREPTPEIIDVLLSSADMLKRLVNELSANTDAQIDLLVGEDKAGLEHVMRRLGHVLDGTPSGASVGSPASPTGPASPPAGPSGSGQSNPAPLEDTMPRMLEEFRIEAAENLQAAEAALVKLERDRSNRELINCIFRSIHTIKGTADYLGFEVIRDFAHAYESLLDVLRHDVSIEVTDKTFDVCFESADYLKTACANPMTTPRPSPGLVERLHEQPAALGARAGSPPPPSAAACTDSVQVFLVSAGQQLSAMQACHQKILAGDTQKKVVEAYLRATRSLKAGAEFVGCAPVAEAAVKAGEILEIVHDGRLGFEKEFLELLDEYLGAVATGLDRLRSRGALDPIDAPPAVARPTLAPAETELAPTASVPPERGAASAPESTRDDAACANRITASSAEVATPKVQNVKTMRIEQDKLDTFMNLVGELIITKNTFAHIAKRIESNDFTDELLVEFKSGVFSINRISGDLQANVMDMRMVPVRNVFARFPRLVRDLTRKNGKRVNLVVHGEDTELDKGIAEDIGDPLVHIIRNAVDHGIESPEARRAAGKDETGAIVLRAAHEGNAIVIEITDDGAGIDPDKVRRKAVERGLVSADEADRLTDQDIIKLICRPGFSTAETVTDVSGRGVGMDVVNTNISKLSGTVRIESHVGEGTQIRIELPLTLAIIEALLVSAGGQDFAVPLDAVDETIRIPREQIQHLQGKEAILLRGEPIGLVHLRDLLQLERGTAANQSKLPVVVLSIGVQRIGVVVDELHDQEEIVIKPLDECLASIRGLGGASIMGDGRIVMILDPLEIVAMASGDRETAEGRRQRPF
ncbi:MAG: chemotaxis protein CheA [Verrucomicrobia bacterium]|nr:chemotaxis protein CheA [Verrucomicrobiota bacterium]